MTSALLQCLSSQNVGLKKFTLNKNFSCFSIKKRWLIKTKRRDEVVSKDAFVQHTKNWSSYLVSLQITPEHNFWCIKYKASTGLSHPAIASIFCNIRVQRKSFVKIKEFGKNCLSQRITGRGHRRILQRLLISAVRCCNPANSIYKCVRLLLKKPHQSNQRKISSQLTLGSAIHVPLIQAVIQVINALIYHSTPSYPMLL